MLLEDFPFESQFFDIKGDSIKKGIGADSPCENEAARHHEIRQVDLVDSSKLRNIFVDHSQVRCDVNDHNQVQETPVVRVLGVCTEQ